MNDNPANHQTTQEKPTRDKTAGQARKPKMSRKSRKAEKKRQRTPLPQNFVTRFRVETYDGTRIERKVVEREEANAIDLMTYDSVLVDCLGKSGYRDPATGRWVDFIENHRRIEGKLLKVLEVIQNRPGVRLGGMTLAELTGEEDINPSDTLRLRRAFGETKQTEHYILTDRGIAWRKDATWIRVEMTVREQCGLTQTDDPQP